ncbi:hypothetical protein J1779_07875 [Rahnella sp. FC061912-K]|uniref:hypothetical protein n=1 Tax=Rahnella rivi TaxID=2816249 RepID=UPI001C25FFE9|nr:hypothetical protein [Rahnella rivi]MBU9829848.1 hypothetical protein [Rahnella rivi]
MKAEQAKARKIGYMRSARLCKKMNCSLRRKDVLRAMHYRNLERELSASPLASCQQQ